MKPFDDELMEARAELGKLSEELVLAQAENGELKRELSLLRAEASRLRYRVKFPRNRPDPMPSVPASSPGRVNAPNWRKVMGL